jgi:hypothetical protein
MNYYIQKTIMALLLVFILSCKTKTSTRSSNQEMIKLLASKDSTDVLSPENNFSYIAKMNFCDSLLNTPLDTNRKIDVRLLKAQAYLQKGNENESISISKEIINSISKFDDDRRTKILKNVALSYLRLGERDNCVLNHANQSCIFPIATKAVHKDKMGSSEAIIFYEILLRHNPNDLESRWLLNIAYMTLGKYPKDVPPAFLLKGLDAPSEVKVKPFVDVAANTGLAIKNQSGGVITDDFNNDGYLDIVTSSWDLKEGLHYYQSKADGTFVDLSASSGLAYFNGGLNMVLTDYNNDGLKDIFVLRGAWKGKIGNDPNSLLKNNGNGTFTDVTKASGLLSFHPTQTATWADFNNDGWLDVFIGNESQPNIYNPSELYMNNKNGTFNEVAAQTGCQINAFVKGVTAGDYNNDGFVDIFVSTLNGDKILLQNKGVKNNLCQFTNVSAQAGLTTNKASTFPTWFWDYDNDGWLDILVCGYDFKATLATYAAADALNIPVTHTGQVFLFRNKQDGTFEEVSEKVGFNKVAFAMGSNFGDIDNDGFLDFYLGTGNPKYESLVPNKMYKNMDGKRFVDVTTDARVGNLQKGHGVAFADLDNDGDQDIYIDMGGAYVGDAYPNSFYQNPGQNNNNWLDLNVIGTNANKIAIGAKLKIRFTDNGQERLVYREVNTGGSFGCNPLRQHIGVGQANKINAIEITWPGSKTVQVFKNIAINQIINLKEGNTAYTKTVLKQFHFNTLKTKSVMCEVR